MPAEENVIVSPLEQYTVLRLSFVHIVQFHSNLPAPLLSSLQLHSLLYQSEADLQYSVKFELCRV